MLSNSSRFKVTTFNVLHNKKIIEERYSTLFKELEATKSDVTFLQEVRADSYGLLAGLAEQYEWYVSAGDIETRPDSDIRYYGNVTLTKTQPVHTAIIQVEFAPEKPLIMVETETELLFNLHLAWGSHMENVRRSAAIEVNSLAESFHAEHPTKLIIAGGDYNATLESSTLRYLKGLDVVDGNSTLWTNIWDMVEPFPTARKEGGWAEETALSVGIRFPELLPDRTLDHLMSYGFNYGRRGCPLSLEKFGISTLSNGFALSDHYGLTVEFLL